MEMLIFVLGVSEILQLIQNTNVGLNLFVLYASGNGSVLKGVWRLTNAR